jgi:predicted nucleic acid-binding protein
MQYAKDAIGLILLESSVWLSYVVATDVHHSRTERWLRSAVGLEETFAAPTLLLVETAGAVARRTGDTSLGKMTVEDLFRLPGFALIPFSSELVTLATQLAAELHLTGVDAVFVATASEAGLPLVTLDREILTRAAGTIEVFAPP